ncbi:MAG: FAD-dependent oxidoreductase [Bacteroidota bacterium]
MTKKTDYIIVGSGLAGTSLAMALLRREKSIRIFNSPNFNSSTHVAGGLYNPITGRKMVKTWKADELFPSLLRFYGELQKTTGKNFLKELRIYRPFVSLEEQNEWMGKSVSSEYSPYVHQIHMSSTNPDLNDDFGGLELSQSGYLDTTIFLKASHELFIEKGLLVDETFDFSNLKISSTKVEYLGFEALKVIFCEGTYLSSNPYFNWLPFSPVKGEILTIESELNTTVIVNRGVFCVPKGGNQFRVGSNYDNTDLSWIPTDKALVEIEDKLKALLKVPFKTIHQKAGVRPATKDRRPYIGLHPKNETIGMFNGLGTKGVSLAPFFGEHFAAFLNGETELDNEVNISRYFSLS